MLHDASRCLTTLQNRARCAAGRQAYFTPTEDLGGHLSPSDVKVKGEAKKGASSEPYSQLAHHVACSRMHVCASCMHCGAISVSGARFARSGVRQHMRELLTRWQLPRQRRHHVSSIWSALCGPTVCPFLAYDCSNLRRAPAAYCGISGVSQRERE